MLTGCRGTTRSLKQSGGILRLFVGLRNSVRLTGSTATTSANSTDNLVPSKFNVGTFWNSVREAIFSPINREWYSRDACCGAIWGSSKPASETPELVVGRALHKLA